MLHTSSLLSSAHPKALSLLPQSELSEETAAVGNDNLFAIFPSLCPLAGICAQEGPLRSQF